MKISGGYLFVAISGILSGLLVFGGQIFLNMGLSVYEISVLPYLIVAIILSPLVIKNKKYRPRGMPFIWILYGVTSGATVLAQYTALILGVPVAMVVLLLYTQPLWTLVISKFCLKEHINKKGIFASILVFLGVIVLVNPFGISSIENILGVIVALIGGITLSGWIVLGSFVSKKNNHPISIKFTETTIALIFIIMVLPLLLILVRQPELTNLSFMWPTEIWVYLALYAVFAILINHLSYYIGAKKVPTFSAGVIMLLEPVVAAVLSVIFLSQALTVNLILGGVIILLANYIVIRNK